jgi:hypothetical protein
MNWLAHLLRAAPVAAIALAGCSATPSSSVSGSHDIAEAQRHYLTAKARCVAEYPRSLVAQSDCRTRAANAYIRPYYRYGDLMNQAQEERRALAMRVDVHQLSRRTFDRDVAQYERTIAREEDRRNKEAGVASSYSVTPFTPVIATMARIFQ